jgi:hypothetical protein
MNKNDLDYLDDLDGTRFWKEPAYLGDPIPEGEVGDARMVFPTKSSSTHEALGIIYYTEEEGWVVVGLDEDQIRESILNYFKSNMSVPTNEYIEKAIKTYREKAKKILEWLSYNQD